MVRFGLRPWIKTESFDRKGVVSGFPITIKRSPLITWGLLHFVRNDNINANKWELALLSLRGRSPKKPLSCLLCQQHCHCERSEATPADFFASLR
jgi:hypothetical protein